MRTFCQNPGGFVAQENYDNDLAVVNGHSLQGPEKQQHQPGDFVQPQLYEPFNQPIAYAPKGGRADQHAGRPAHSGAAVRRYFGRQAHLAAGAGRANVQPTLKDAVAGDITAAMPYRAMVNIIEFIKMMDQVVPGFAAPETLLYSPELKFYSNKVKMDTDLETNLAGLHCLGDSSGWTRGLRWRRSWAC